MTNVIQQLVILQVDTVTVVDYNEQRQQRMDNHQAYEAEEFDIHQRIDDEKHAQRSDGDGCVRHYAEQYRHLQQFHRPDKVFLQCNQLVL